MRYLFILFSLLFFNYGYSQVVYTSARPDDLDTDSTIKQNHIKKENVFQFNHKSKNKDSTLLVTKYFNEEGQCVEMDEFSYGENPVSVRNYDYVDGKLTKVEALYNNTIIINDRSATRQIITYDYDSLGNKEAEKIYSKYSTESVLKFSGETKWEYNSERQITKVFDGPIDSIYLHFVYYYDGNKLSRIEALDNKGKWIYSYLYEYDKSDHSESIYLKNAAETLENKFFYNEQNNLIKSLSFNSYLSGYIYGFVRSAIHSDHSTTEFEYLNSLVTFEKLQLTDGNITYFRYYYENKFYCY